MPEVMRRAMARGARVPLGRSGRAGAVIGSWLLLAAAALPRATDAPLAEAAMRGDLATVRTLIAKRADVNAAQGDGMTALHWAAERGDSVMATLLLKAGAKVTAATRLGGYLPLHVASRNARVAVVRALLERGADPNATTLGGATALHLAAASGSAGAVEALLRHKGDPNAREAHWGQTPLMFAAAADRADAIRVLVARGADARITTHTVDLAQQAAREQAAARRRNEVLFSYLPQRQKDSIVAAFHKARAVRDSVARAAARRDSSARRDSAAKPGTKPEAKPGARPDTAFRIGLDAPPVNALTPSQIQEAIEEGRKVLTRTGPNGGEVESDTSDGQVAGFEKTVGAMGGLTALHHAVRQGHVAATMALLDGGADIDQPSATDSTTPLLLATINGHFDLAMQLVQRGADVKRASTHGNTPLYAAINTAYLPRSRFPQPQAVQNQRTTHVELMTALLTKGADVNARLKTNLWFFAYNNCGNSNCGLELLDGTTPFWRAAYSVDVEAMRLLKEHGADPTIPSFRRVTAADSARQRALRARFGGGGGPENGPAGRLDPQTDSAAKAVPPGIGVYPIHAAAGVGYGNGFAGNSHRHAPEGWMPALRYLVEELGADVNQRDLNGYTPLHHAAARGDNEMILYLVSKGADVKAVARNGRTTVDMANGPVQRLRPFPETIALLEKLGAKNSHRCVSC